MSKKNIINNKNDNELKNTSYELFIASLSILSIINLIFISFFSQYSRNAVGILGIMNGLFSFIFLVDFVYRIYISPSKSKYFFKEFGWADLLASLPFAQFKILRVFRLIRIFRISKKYGFKNLLKNFIKSRGESALLTIFLLIIILLEFGGISILRIESQSPDANIKTPSDALWWIIVTVTTVGYGDKFPVTDYGRLMGVLVMGVGIGLVGTLTGFLANAFLAPQNKK